MPEKKTTEKLKVIEWNTRTGLTRKFPMRMKKMVAAVCPECRGTGYGWWDACPHDPYHTMQAIEDPTARFIKQDDGTYIEDTSKTQVIKAYRRVPNVRQVPLTLRVDSGMSVESALAKGWKFPENVDPGDGEHTGYAPMCEFENCYKALPGVSTTHPSLSENKMVPTERYTARYCSTDHAKRAKLKDSGQVRYVPEATEDSATSARMQLEQVVL